MICLSGFYNYYYYYINVIQNCFEIFLNLLNVLCIGFFLKKKFSLIYFN